MDELSKLILQTARATAKEKALAISFLLGAAYNRFQPLLDGLENQFTLGVNNYPMLWVAAYNILKNFKRDRAVTNPSAGANVEVSFAHTGGDDDKGVPKTRAGIAAE